MTSIDNNRITSFCQIKMEVFIKLKVVSNAIDLSCLGTDPLYCLYWCVCVHACVCVRDLWPLELVTAEQTTGFITTNVSQKLLSFGVCYIREFKNIFMCIPSGISAYQGLMRNQRWLTLTRTC